MTPAGTAGRIASPLAGIVAPRSVAVIGASDDVGKFGGRVIHYLISHGYGGRLLPINPNRATIRGLPAYPSVGQAPGPVDVAILAVPVAHLLRQVEDCAAAGVGACIIITGKLADAGAEGAALQDRVLAVAQAAGMRLVGPNCLGIFNFTDRALLSSCLALEADALKPGGIGMVSQSGALMGTLVSLGQRYGAGFSRCISVGNQADLELCDFLDFLIDGCRHPGHHPLHRGAARPLPLRPAAAPGAGGGQAGALRQGRALGRGRPGGAQPYRQPRRLLRRLRRALPGRRGGAAGGSGRHGLRRRCAGPAAAAAAGRGWGWR